MNQARQHRKTPIKPARKILAAWRGIDLAEAEAARRDAARSVGTVLSGLPIYRLTKKAAR